MPRCVLPLQGRHVVETSTVAPETLRGIAPALGRAGARMIDATVSGGPEMVVERRGATFPGGAPEDVARARPVVADLAAQAPHLGPLGAGAAAGAMNDSPIAGVVESLCAALAPGRASGLAPETLPEILRLSPGTPAVIHGRLDIVAGESERVGVPVADGIRAIALFSRIAAAHGIEIPAIAACLARFERARDAGHGARDLAVVLREALRERSE